MVWIVDNVVELGEQFSTVATTDPVSAVLLAIGALLTGVSLGAFGYLTLRGLLDWVTPEFSSRGPPRGA
jgi:hypothetical protein